MRIGQNASSEKIIKILLTFVGIVVYSIQGCQTRQQQNNRKMRLKPSLKEQKTNQKKLKKLLTNETAHDNINELLTQSTDKQHK